MTVQLSDQTRLSVDSSIHLRKGGWGALPYATIDRELADLLLAIRDTGSVQAACERLCVSPRSAQRKMRRFVDRTGIELLRHHGTLGTELTREGRQCIDMYVAARRCARQIVRESMLPRPLPPLSDHPMPADRDRKTT